MKFRSPKVIATLHLSLLMVFFFDSAHAYMGPGAGLGMIGSLIAVVVVVLVIVVGLVIYPVRVFLRYRKRKFQL